MQLCWGYFCVCLFLMFRRSCRFLDGFWRVLLLGKEWKHIVGEDTNDAAEVRGRKHSLLLLNTFQSHLWCISTLYKNTHGSYFTPKVIYFYFCIDMLF